MASQRQRNRHPTCSRQKKTGWLNNCSRKKLKSKLRTYYILPQRSRKTLTVHNGVICKTKKTVASVSDQHYLRIQASGSPYFRAPGGPKKKYVCPGLGGNMGRKKPLPTKLASFRISTQNFSHLGSTFTGRWFSASHSLGRRNCGVSIWELRVRLRTKWRERYNTWCYVHSVCFHSGYSLSSFLSTFIFNTGLGKVE